LIPLGASSGQVHWSATGGGMMIGRSEQVDLVAGTSSNYACINCCGDNPYAQQVIPASATVDADSSYNFTAQEKFQDCYQNVSEFTDVFNATWTSSDRNVATADANGFVTGQGAGSATISAQWTHDIYHYSPALGECTSSTSQVTRTASVTVKPKIDSITPAASAVGHPVTVTLSGKGFAQGASIDAGAGVTVSEISVSSSTSMSATFSVDANATAGDRNVTVTVNGQTSNSKTFAVQVPDRLRVVSDTGNFGLANCPTVVGRLITYQVSDSSTNHLAIAQAIFVEEAFDNQTTNTCGNGQPSNAFCEPTEDNGQFRDGITMTDTCNASTVANCNANPSCGYEHTQRWSTCFPEAIIELMSAQGITHCNQIRVNNSTRSGNGTLMPK
jgi:hypothetical protein